MKYHQSLKNSNYQREVYLLDTFSLYLFVSKLWRTVCVYENLRSIDSFRFMSCSLQALVSNLHPGAFDLLRNHFDSKTDEQVRLLCQKGFYPYCYMDSFNRFQEDSLPPLKEWKNSLAGGTVTVEPKDVEFANKVFHAFNCETLGDSRSVLDFRHPALGWRNGAVPVILLGALRPGLFTILHCLQLSR